MSLQMPRRPRPSLIASLLAAACVGVGGGALLSWALLSDSSKTVVRQVTVENSEITNSTAPANPRAARTPRMALGWAAMPLARRENAAWRPDTPLLYWLAVPRGGALTVRAPP